MRPALIALMALVTLSALTVPADAQDGGGRRPTLLAARAGKPPTIDGQFAEPAWRAVEPARDFVQQRPHAGRPASERTEVRVLFTDEAIYFAAVLFDSSPDSIVARLGRRDAEVYSDWFWVHLDSQNDRRTAFVFGVSAAGVLRDAMRANDTELHADWDAVWEAAVRRTSDGWTAELRIPLSQLRFAVAERGAEQRWGVNFAREIARREELSYWAPIPPSASGFVSLFGELRGLRDLEPARRLEVRPYLAGRLTRAPGDRANPFFRRTDPFSSLGGDATYGLTSNLTLTATVNPDFGQVEADPAQVNLTAHEMWLPEQRPFFLEGADLFDTGYPQLFYSRRIGRSPQAGVPSDAKYAESADAATILAAAKLAGKTAGGWKIGVLDALTQREVLDYVAATGERRATVVEPMTNYAVARLARDFRNGKSGLGLVATSVHRDLGAEPQLQFLTSRAFAGGLDGHHRFGKGDVRLTGSLRLSNVAGSTQALSRIQRNSVHRFQRPDADHLEFDSTRTSLSGVRASLDVGKIGGGHWRWSLGAHVTTPGYEINDLGFSSQSDRRAGYLSLAYAQFEPGSLFRRWELSGFANTSSTGGGERTGGFFDLTLDAQLRNYWNVMTWVDWEIPALSTEALRGGPAMLMPAALYAYLRVETDRRKPVIVGMSGFLRRERGTDGRVFYVTPSLTVRPSTQMELTLKPRMEWNREASQYVTAAQIGDSTTYVFAPMRQRTASLTARLNYTISPSVSIQAYAQPFVSAGDYRGFKVVRDPRGTRESARFRILEESRISESRDAGRRTYGLDLDGVSGADVWLPDPDFNSRQFRSNVVLRWEYRPGSTLFVAWSQSRDGFDPDGSFALGRDARRLFAARGTNVVMVKVSYWLSL
jgi:hypothetical protein